MGFLRIVNVLSLRLIDTPMSNLSRHVIVVPVAVDHRQLLAAYSALVSLFSPYSVEGKRKRKKGRGRTYFTIFTTFICF